MIQRLLVANRGEIARRVFATCRRLGIQTVAVHSDADATLPFVGDADIAVRLPGDAATDTYLRGDLVVAAAKRAGADAVHPGYGFLSESAEFARQVLEAGLTWIGPTPESVELMGSKVEAKKLAAAAGVPVLESLGPDDATPGDLPLLVKASAGGGGRGMRLVRRLEDLPTELARARAEAHSAFGDGTVFVEPYVEQARHVEVQVVGDRDGILVLGDRDCSVQRRHQKVVEEAPAPFLTGPGLREGLHAGARAAAEAIEYLGAGTVEFLVDPAAARFYFLEMNTRLQVEHPVTECVHDVDLVELQIAVAEGRSLVEVVGEQPPTRGHAVEVRLYAEDPASDWQPQSGRLTRLEIPDVDAEFTAPTNYGIRLDAGVGSGDEVGTFYDGMLAKVVSWGPSRDAAVRRLAACLERARIHGVRTNRDLLVNVLRHDAFQSGDVSTDFFDRHDVAQLAVGRADATAVRLSAFAATALLAERSRAESPVQQGIPAGWRSVVSQAQLTRFACDDPAAVASSSADGSRLVEVRWHGGRDGYRSVDLDARVTGLSGTTVTVAAASSDTSVRFEVYVDGDHVHVESLLGHVALRRVPRFVDPADRVVGGSLLAPMPAAVVKVAVGVGDQVTAGDVVLVLEAMKMQHTVCAPHDGVVEQLPVAVGHQVAAGSVLAVLAETGSAAD